MIISLLLSFSTFPSLFSASMWAGDKELDWPVVKRPRLNGSIWNPGAGIVFYFLYGELRNNNNSNNRLMDMCLTVWSIIISRRDARRNNNELIYLVLFSSSSPGNYEY